MNLNEMTDSEILEKYYSCEYCDGVPGYSDCNCYPPVEIVLYDNEGNASVWSGPIGCMRPEQRKFCEGLA